MHAKRRERRAERVPPHQDDGRVSAVQRKETPDAVVIPPGDSESTLPVATDTGIRQMTTVDATLVMPPASPGDMDSLPVAVTIDL